MKRRKLNDGFFIEHVTNDDFDLTEVYRFRYENYSFEKKATLFPDGLVYDEYDESGIHFVIKKENRIYGAARGLVSNSSRLEIEMYLETGMLLNNYLCCEVSKLILCNKIRNGYYSSELFRYLLDYGKNEGAQFAFIFFRQGLMEEYYGRLGFSISRKTFIYKNERNPFYGLEHKFGIMQIR